jgi:hypothetical protein
MHKAKEEEEEEEEEEEGCWYVCCNSVCRRDTGRFPTKVFADTASTTWPTAPQCFVYPVGHNWQLPSAQTSCAQAKVLSLDPEACVLRNNTLASGTDTRGLVCVEPLANRSATVPGASAKRYVLRS